MEFEGRSLLEGHWRVVSVPEKESTRHRKLIEGKGKAIQEEGKEVQMVSVSIPFFCQGFKYRFAPVNLLHLQSLRTAKSGRGCALRVAH